MSIQKITLRKPLLVNGVERKELTYDIEELTIGHIAQAEGYKSKIGGTALVGSLSLAQTDYPLQICIGMQAIIAVNPEISEEDLSRIKGYDLTKLATIGTSFFVEPAATVEGNNSEKPQEDTQNITTVQ